MFARVAIFLAFALILGVPFLLHEARTPTGGSVASGDAETLVIVTPHVPQIRDEFGQAFEAWHRRKFPNEPAVRVDWRAPGGTTEIIKLLQDQVQARIRSGAFNFTDPKNPTCKDGTVDFDLVLGGGSFDHGRLKQGVQTKVMLKQADGSMKETEVTVPISTPAGFSKAELDAYFGENAVGAQTLYDPQQFWIGTALSSFGIVYNRDMFRELNLPEPKAFEDLTDPRLMGKIIMADPRQSGSVATTLDSILSNFGWEKGWRVIRETCANTRTFSNSAPKPPIDVSQGEAAAGLAIDFYGRGQAQAVLAPGEDPANSRVGYVDPAGAVYIDADPASILRGARRPVLAKRFIEFCLSEEGQAMWQFPAVGGPNGLGKDPRSVNNPKGENGEPMGPRIAELRRLPVRRVMYEKYKSVMIDQVDPFVLASTTTPKGWRSALGPMMGAFAIDTAAEQRAAWRALNRARERAKAGQFSAQTLAEMERLFYSWPTTPVVQKDGNGGAVKELEFTAENFKAIRDEWRRPGVQARLEIRYTGYFREVYSQVGKMGR
jgi:iron(III) transport system substrate-binding protein